MTQDSVQTLSPFSQIVTVAIIIPTQPLLTESDSVVPSGGQKTSTSNFHNLTARANTITTSMREFEGYSHYGLNE
jgi:hypothetical protein